MPPTEIESGRGSLARWQGMAVSWPFEEFKVSVEFSMGHTLPAGLWTGELEFPGRGQGWRVLRTLSSWECGTYWPEAQGESLPRHMGMLQQLDHHTVAATPSHEHQLRLFSAQYEVTTAVRQAPTVPFSNQEVSYFETYCSRLPLRLICLNEMIILLLFSC